MGRGGHPSPFLFPTKGWIRNVERSKTVPIPPPLDPLTTPYNFWIFLAPDTLGWTSVVDGLLFSLTRGRSYRRSTGSIIGAQEVGREIYESIMTVKAEHLIGALREIAAAVAGTSVDFDNPIPAPTIVDYSSLGLRPQLVTAPEGKAIADVVEDMVLSVTNQVNPATVNVTNEVIPAAVNVTNDVFPATVNVTNEVNPASVFVEWSGGGCGCGGTEPPSQPGTEGDPPPLGWTEPTGTGGVIINPGSQEYQTRKCQVANYLHGYFRDGIGQIKDISLFGIGLSTITTLLGASWLVAISTLLTSGLAVVGGTIAAIGLQVAGYLDELAQSLVENGVDLTTLHNLLIANEQDLVCAIYSATDATEAIDNYLGVLDTAGIGVANRAVVFTLFTIDYANLAFFQKEEVVEAQIDAYTPTVDCSLCGCGNQIQFNYGQIVSDDGSLIVADSTFADNFWRVAIVFNSFGGVVCGPTVTTSNALVTSGVVTPPGAPKAYRAYSDTGSGETGDIYNDDAIPGNLTGVRRFVVTSNTQFSIQVNYT